jgi:hypothetical protein
MENSAVYQELRIKSRIKLLGICLLLVGVPALFQIKDHASFIIFNSAFLVGLFTSQLIKYVGQLRELQNKRALSS